MPPHWGQTAIRLIMSYALRSDKAALWFRPGQPVAVELNGGREDLPLRGDHTHPPRRLCAILLDRLVRFEDTFMDLAGHIPAIAARTASSS